jgi:hypothetical protein
LAALGRYQLPDCADLVLRYPFAAPVRDRFFVELLALGGDLGAGMSGVYAVNKSYCAERVDRWRACFDQLFTQQPGSRLAGQAADVRRNSIPTFCNATENSDTIRPNQPRLDIFATRLVQECETSFRVCTMKLRNGSDKTEPHQRP